MALTATDVINAGQGRFDDEVLAGDTLRRVWGAVRGYCEWSITAETGVVLELDGSGTRALQLPTLALSSVASVTEDGVELDAGAFTWSKSGILRKRVGCWTSEYRGVVATVDHGFADESEPVSAVEGVVLQVCIRAMTAPAGQVGLRVGQVDERFATTVGGFGFFASEFEVLDKYVIPGSG